MNAQKRIVAFSKLGKFLACFKNRDYFPDYISNYLIKHYHSINKLIEDAKLVNAWFTEENVRHAIVSISGMLERDNIERWLIPYMDRLSAEKQPKKTGVVMAGNIPLVGFHDFFCVLMSGNRFYGKVSSDDPGLLKKISEVLITIEPDFKEYIELTGEKLSGFDAIIATGSDNTSRYFKFYFEQYPHIIRKNRNGLAILNGMESRDELIALGEDIFRYFGRGCRNVSKIFVPENYNFNELVKAFESYSQVQDHRKYMNNYDYNKSILILNKTPFIDNGFVIIKEDETLVSPISVLNVGYYKKTEEVSDFIDTYKDKIQCVVTNSPDFKNTIPIGKSQFPELWDYADGIDTMDFLLKGER